MTKEEIVKAWFAIDELSENVTTELYSFRHLGRHTKMYTATINFSCGYKFMSQDTDVYKAMKTVINEYSEFIIKNEKKQ